MTDLFDFYTELMIVELLILPDLIIGEPTQMIDFLFDQFFLYSQFNYLCLPIIFIRVYI
jgi:hypothetical protein